MDNVNLNQRKTSIATSRATLRTTLPYFSRLTPDHPVNSYLSVGNLREKTRALYLSRFNFGGSIKCKSTFFPNNEKENFNSSTISVKIADFPKFFDAIF